MAMALVSKLFGGVEVRRHHERSLLQALFPACGSDDAP
jgi:hypothetical protein